MDPAEQGDHASRHVRSVTAGGVHVTRTEEPFDERVLDSICAQVQDRRGGVLSSGMEYPGRYSRWHMAYVDPCAEIVARGRRISVRALNARGEVLLPVLGAALLRAGEPVAQDGQATGGSSAAGLVEVLIPEPVGLRAEEERSRRPTVFSALREVIAAMAGDDPNLGLRGGSAPDLPLQVQGVRRAGAAALDLCSVACGRFEAFWEFGLKPWDTAAGMLLVEEAGGRVTDFQEKPYHPGDREIVASYALIHDELCRVVREIAALPEATGARGWEPKPRGKNKSGESRGKSQELEDTHGARRRG